MPRKKLELIRFTTIKEYIKDVAKMRSSDAAVEKLINRLEDTIADVVAEATRLAKEDRRKTIMEYDIDPALEKHVGKKHLTWQETAAEVIRHSPADLGKISKTINDYISQVQEKEQRAQFRRLKKKGIV